MSTPVRVGAFLAALAVLFGAAFGVGKVFEDEPETYSLRAQLEPGALFLTIFDGDGHVVLGYETRHEKQLHLIAVRKDFGGYQHLHPTDDGSGGWTAPGAALGAGDWRLYADFQPKGGEPTVAYDDLTVGGEPGVAAPEPSGATATVDGYQVDVREDAGSLGFTVLREGRPVVDLEPYLGAYGHLVVIRESDLDFLHVHPDDGPAGPQVRFGVSGTSPGRYRTYFEFQHAGVVRTVPFALDLGTTAEHGGDHGDH